MIRKNGIIIQKRKKNQELLNRFTTFQNNTITVAQYVTVLKNFRINATLNI